MTHKIIKIIKNHIEETGVSKAEVAEKSGVPYHDVKRILRGEKTPNINEIEALLSVFDLKMKSYVGHKDDPHFDLIDMISSLNFNKAKITLDFVNSALNR